MALLIKNQPFHPGGLNSNLVMVDQWIRVPRATKDLPAGAAEALFNVVNGEIIVKLLYGRVTTLIQTQTCNTKITLNPTTGTSGDVASNLDITADEVGTIYLVEGDGTALVGVTAGTSWTGAGLPNYFIVNAGTIDIETGATNTGQIAWTLFYMPLVPGAYVTAA